MHLPLGKIEYLTRKEKFHKKTLHFTPLIACFKQMRVCSVCYTCAQKLNYGISIF